MPAAGFLVSYTTLAHPGARVSRASPSRRKVPTRSSWHAERVRHADLFISRASTRRERYSEYLVTYSTRASRLQLVVLRKLAESGRAVATRGVATRLFAPRRRLQAMGSRALPDVLFWKILEFWRTDRDP